MPEALIAVEDRQGVLVAVRWRTDDNELLFRDFLSNKCFEFLGVSGKAFPPVFCCEVGEQFNITRDETTAQSALRADSKKGSSRSLSTAPYQV